MTFATFETSIETGTPVELYEIAFGNTIYRYTSTEDDFELEAITWSGSDIQRSPISASQENRSESVSFSIDAANEFVQEFRGITPGRKAIITVFRFHRLDTPNLERAVFWKGIIQSVQFTEQLKKATMTALPLTVALSRTIPRFTYQGQCNHILFDERCKVAEASFTYSGNASAVTSDGLTITVDGLNASKGNDFAVGGVLTNVPRTDFRLILAQTTDQVRVLFPFSSSFSIVGETLEVLAGCDHTIAVCKTKFNNVINYGGFHFIPERNPFTAGIQA